MSAIEKVDVLPAAVEQALIVGDLSKLNAEQRVVYYNRVCTSVGLNPLTKPFDYITLNGRLTLYARKDATDQLRNIHNISVVITAREVVDDCYVVTARATTPAGRTDESIGAVASGALKGEAKCNAMMKAETKAKRRVTLSICGLGMLDESEIESIPNAKTPAPVAVTTEAKTYSKKFTTAISEPVPVVQSVPKDEPAEAVEVVPVAGADCINAGEAANFHRMFKDALPAGMRKDSAEMAHEWLRKQGILDVLGKPSALAIKKANFYDVRNAAIEYAGVFRI